jgi:hypothetical protein
MNCPHRFIYTCSSENMEVNKINLSQISCSCVIRLDLCYVHTKTIFDMCSDINNKNALENVS